MLRNRRGIAMLTAMMLLVFMVIVMGLVIFAVTRGVQVSGSARRSFTAFEAAEAGIELGMVRIEDFANRGVAIGNDNITIDQQDVTTNIQYLFVGPVAGSNLAFASGYHGIGKGAAAGGAQSSYWIESDAVGQQREYTGLEIVYRKMIGISAR